MAKPPPASASSRIRSSRHVAQPAPPRQRHEPTPPSPRTPPKAAARAAVATPKSQQITIPAPNLQVLEFHVQGTAPYVQHRFAKKSEIMAAQAEGSTSRGKKTREAKDFEANCEAAKHLTDEGWCGIPASSFRAAMISACRLVGFHMSRAKLSVFVLPDGFDIDGLPVVRIVGTPEMHTGHVRNETGVIDIRARPLWRKWSCTVRVQYDADQFTATDVANLMQRAGMQVGIGEGRHDSKKSLTGMGWGTFTIEE